MADVTYSAPLLTRLGDDMVALSTDVRADPEVAGIDVLHLARAEVVSALLDFESDWSSQSQALASQLESGGGLASAAAASFTDADRTLAESALAETD